MYVGCGNSWWQECYLARRTVYGVNVTDKAVYGALKLRMLCAISKEVGKAEGIGCQSLSQQFFLGCSSHVHWKV